jgi:hypothetical protein
MAVVKSNVITKGLSGKFGQDIVFRMAHGMTYAATPPTVTDRELTEGQVAHRKRFQSAVIYSKAATADPVMKAAYKAAALKKGWNSAMIAAVSDYFNAPEIQEVNLSGYKGVIGDVISVKVTDDFKVSSVSLEILTADSVTIEKGNATLSTDGITWNYTVTSAPASLAGVHVVVKAEDLPGNSTQKDQSL